MISALRGAPLGPWRPWEAALDLPPAHRMGGDATTRSAVGAVFKHLRHARVAVLLSQKGALDGRFPELAVRRAQETLGVGRVLSASLVNRPRDFATHLGQSLRLGRPTPDQAAFEAAFRETLSPDRPNYLFLRGFERLSPEPLRWIATFLRSEVETPGRYGELHVVLQGGRKLSDMCHADENNSLLSNAEILFWPEMGAEDLRLLAPEADDFAEGEAEMLLLESGGRPDLARELLAARGDLGRPLERSECQKLLLSGGVAAMAAFGSLRRQTEAFREELAETLERDRIGRWSFAGREFPLWAFWSDLARRGEGGWLVWRCEALREAGRRALAAL